MNNKNVVNTFILFAGLLTILILLLWHFVVSNFNRFKLYLFMSLGKYWGKIINTSQKEVYISRKTGKGCIKVKKSSPKENENINQKNYYKKGRPTNLNINSNKWSGLKPFKSGEAGNALLGRPKYLVASQVLRIIIKI